MSSFRKVAVTTLIATASLTGTAAASTVHLGSRHEPKPLPEHRTTMLCSDAVVRCDAEVVEYKTKSGKYTAGTKTPLGYYITPADIHRIYHVPDDAKSPQTVAIVDAYDNPLLNYDLSRFDRQYQLPACSEHDGCLSVYTSSGHKVNDDGKPTVTDAEEFAHELDYSDWVAEIDLDVETVHSVCQNCHIDLVEAANDKSRAPLVAAEREATKLGAKIVSNSWGFTGYTGTASSAFNQPGDALFFAAGDNGYLGDPQLYDGASAPSYPADLPSTIAVGGTTLAHTKSGVVTGQKVWDGSGSGCSMFPAAPWQTTLNDWANLHCPGRVMNDLALDANPYTGLAIFSSSPALLGGWGAIGGTSLATPMAAAMLALAGGPQGVPYPAQILYGNSQKFTPVKSGSNAQTSFLLPASGSNCTSEFKLLCSGADRFNGPGGLGYPSGLEAFTDTLTPAQIVSSLP